MKNQIEKALDYAHQYGGIDGSHTPAWELALRLLRKVKEKELSFDKLNQDYDVLVKDYQKLSERQTCECGMAPTIKIGEGK